MVTGSVEDDVPAAYAAVSLSHFIRKLNYRNHLVGSMTLVNASIKAGVRCFVFASSISVYGPNQVPMHEDLTPLPDDPPIGTGMQWVSLINLTMSGLAAPVFGDGEQTRAFQLLGRCGGATKKAAQILGARAEGDLSTGITRMSDWARRVGARQSMPFRNIEILKKLPTSWAGLVKDSAPA